MYPNMRRYQDTVTDGNLVFDQQVLHQGCQTKKAKQGRISQESHKEIFQPSKTIHPQ